MKEVDGKDLVAATGIVVCGLLIYSGHNSAIIAILSTILGWYFGRKS